MANRKKKKEQFPWQVIVAIIFIGYILIKSFPTENIFDDDPASYSSNKFYLISSSENKVFEQDILNFAKKNNIKIQIEYDDTLKITRRLNRGEQFDAVWLSNSIWMYAVDSNVVKISDTKSTSINPIVFGVRKSKAEELGFVDKELYTEDLVKVIQEGNLKFSMPNPITTNSGASAYLGILTSLAGNPEVLTSDMLADESLKDKLKDFFSGLERSSGDEDYLEEMFVNGDYEAVFSYESSIIHINQKLEENGKEILYALYPVDGVSISDSPIGYIDQKDEKKKEQYQLLVNYLVSEEGQKILSAAGRRTWYGGVSDQVDQTVFNPNWGIDTTRYISPLKYPATAVIKEALVLYQNSLRKPVHVVFCLDYSGSMWGEGISELVNAMDYILTDRAADELLQFTGEDIVDVIPFNSKTNLYWTAHSEEELALLNEKIKEHDPNGGTALYPAAKKALSILKDEDTNQYMVSVIVMTDGEGNVGTFDELSEYYHSIESTIPIYSIQFSAADRSQLEKMAKLSNGKVFDGTTSLIDAFTEVRGYN
jgi:Ca-activated chloride channel family protein